MASNTVYDIPITNGENISLSAILGLVNKVLKDRNSSLIVSDILITEINKAEKFAEEGGLDVTWNLVEGSVKSGEKGVPSCENAVVYMAFVGTIVAVRIMPDVIVMMELAKQQPESADA